VILLIRKQTCEKFRKVVASGISSMICTRISSGIKSRGVLVFEKDFVATRLVLDWICIRVFTEVVLRFEFLCSELPI
jgi:hypothetical protein